MPSLTYVRDLREVTKTRKKEAKRATSKAYRSRVLEYARAVLLNTLANAAIVA